MPNELQGDPTQSSARYAVVVSRYNESITSKLLNGALKTLDNAGVDEDAIDVVHVPGAWEIPLIARRLAGGERHDAVICLGAVIRGETSHDEHINRCVSESLAETAVTTGVPIAFGVLTCGTLEQAIQRSGGTVGNKGIEAAQAALEMVDLLRKLP